MVDDGRRHPRPPDRRLRRPLTCATSSDGARSASCAGPTRPGAGARLRDPLRRGADSLTGASAHTRQPIVVDAGTSPPHLRSLRPVRLGGSAARTRRGRTRPARVALIKLPRASREHTWRVGPPTFHVKRHRHPRRIPTVHTPTMQWPDEVDHSRPGAGRCEEPIASTAGSRATPPPDTTYWHHARAGLFHVKRRAPREDRAVACTIPPPAQTAEPCSHPRPCNRHVARAKPRARRTSPVSRGTTRTAVPATSP